CLLRRQRAGVLAHNVTDRALHPTVEIDEKLHGVEWPARDALQKRGEPRAGGLGLAIAGELMREIIREGEGVSRSVGFDEKVERIDRHELGLQIDRDGKFA